MDRYQEGFAHVLIVLQVQTQTIAEIVRVNWVTDRVLTLQPRRNRRDPRSGHITPRNLDIATNFINDIVTEKKDLE
jgi:hypothetical protein